MKMLLLMATWTFAAPAPAPDPAPQKATDLYPNDFGDTEIDVSGYPKDKKEGYKLMQFKCAACHTTARPINAQYIELTPDEQAQFKKDNPEIAKDERIAAIDEKAWNRMVKRMMAKPGCPVKPEDGKKIWEFLVYDSRVRKTGENAKAWAAHRAKLLHEFEEHHKEAYVKLFGSAPAPKEAGK